MKTRIHAIAGAIGFLTILTFWTSTVYSEVFGTHETIIAVKNAIVLGLFILVPSMAIVGGSGMSLGKKRRGKLIEAKKKKMPIISREAGLIGSEWGREHTQSEEFNAKLDDLIEKYELKKHLYGTGGYELIKPPQRRNPM